MIDRRDAKTLVTKKNEGPGNGPLFFRRGTPHGANLAAGSTAAIKQVCPIGLEPADHGIARHFEPLEHVAGLRVDPADVALLPFPGPVPQLAVHPGHAGDEAVGFDGALDDAGLRINLVDLAIAVLPHPQTALRPGQPRVAPASGRRDRGTPIAGAGIDLVDPRFRYLVEVRAIEGGACVAGAVERARGLTAFGIEGDRTAPRAGPDPA